MVFIVLSMGQFGGFRRTSASSFFFFFNKAKEEGGDDKGWMLELKVEKIIIQRKVIFTLKLQSIFKCCLHMCIKKTSANVFIKDQDIRQELNAGN